MKKAFFLAQLVVSFILITSTVVPAAGNPFSQNDLAGTWHYFGFSDGPTGTDASWFRGTLTIDLSGNVTGGSGTDSGGHTITFTGGSFTLTNSGTGEFSASLSTTCSPSCDSEANSFDGKLNTTNDMFVGVGESSLGGHIFFVEALK